MRYAQIRKMDISDGPGIRVALYTQGCSIHCKNCHNASIWDFEGGKEFDHNTILQITELADKDYIAGLSILGGEPFANIDNLVGLISLCSWFKSKHPNKTIWVWSGYTYEQLMSIYGGMAGFKVGILQAIDVLVDGPYIEEQKNPNLKYCGSENQRVIDIKKTLKEGKVVLYDLH